MNKAELAFKLSENLNLSWKLAEEVIENLEKIITETLISENEVTIAGFGTFSARTRSARMGVNPRNPKEKIQVLGRYWSRSPFF